MSWKPSEVWNEIKVTPAEFAFIKQRMDGQPTDQNGKYPVDGVFQGGGVWGTAFLGAVRCCEDVGITWVGLGGTSAGAVTAGLLAAGYTAVEMETVFASLNYMDFLKERTYWGFDDNPGNDLESAREIGLLLTSLALSGNLGRYKTDRFHNWYADLLAKKQKTKFGDVFQTVGRINSIGAGPRDLPRQLRVVAADLTHGRLRVLPDAYIDPSASPLDPNSTGLDPALAALPIAHAVRCSMSIPGFFEPARLPAGDKKGAVIVDGGLLSNFPLWLFDDAPGKTPGWPTFGFRLIDGPSNPREIGTITQLLSATFRTMMSASDLYYLGKAAGNRVASIDFSQLLEERPHLTATAFDLSGDDQAALYRVGYQAAKNFFLNQWDWKKHVASRIGAPTAAAAGEVTR